MKRRQTIKARLSDLANALYRGIYDLTPQQRARARRTLDMLTETNCGWTLYALREPLGSFLDMASTGRTRKARAKKKGGQQ